MKIVKSSCQNISGEHPALRPETPPWVYLADLTILISFYSPAMPPVNDSFGSQVSARVLEYFAGNVTWNRGLWSPGLRIQLLEALESSEAVHAKVLHDAALKYLRDNLLRAAMSDPGLGDSRTRQALNTALNSPLVFKGADYFGLQLIHRQVEAKYLGNWAKFLRSGPPIRAERAARSIASHLLDLGFDPRYLHSWWSSRMPDSGPALSLPDLLDEAQLLASLPPQPWIVLAPFESFPPKGGLPEGWLDSKGVKAWLSDNGNDTSGVRQNGGIVLTVTARDPYSVASAVHELIEAMSGRMALSLAVRPVPCGQIWIKGRREPVWAPKHPRRVEIHSLRLKRQIGKVGASTSQIDSAIALLQPINGANIGAAISGAWAVVETLLSSPGDSERVLAAERFASIVACSFPRAELTAISYSIQESNPIAELLRKAPDNRWRARLLAEALQRQQPIAVTSPTQAASLDRIRAILLKPESALADIQQHVAAALRRLYRSRNLILHWGRIDGEIRRCCLRTAAPLIGAGVDRIAHSSLIEDLRPLELASRAAASLSSIKAGEPNLVDLLD